MPEEKINIYHGKFKTVYSTQWHYLKQLCADLKITCKVNPIAYQKMHDKYSNYFSVWPEVEKCIYWLIDKNKRQITTLRLSNWLRKEREFQKRDQRKILTKKVDSIGKTHNLERGPLWVPPK